MKKRSPQIYLNYILERKIGRLIPDKKFLELKGWCILGNGFNISKPKTFNEKLNWLKLNDRKTEYSTMVDKCDAKKYVAQIIGERYIVPTLGVWKTVDEIDFDNLPNQFVLKCTHDSGGMVLCKDKKLLDIEKSKVTLSKFMTRNFYWNLREWPYKNVEHRIIAEKYLDNGEKGLVDYKFYCFNGEPKYLYVSEGLTDHKTAKMSFLDIEWNFAPFGRSDYRPLDSLPDKPSLYDEMLEIAKKLSKGIPFLRVDLYQFDNQVFFSELTFSPCGGFMPFEPREYDRILGELLVLPGGHNE